MYLSAMSSSELIFSIHIWHWFYIYCKLYDEYHRKKARNRFLVCLPNFAVIS